MAPVAGEDVVRTAYSVFRAGATYVARMVGVAGAEPAVTDAMATPKSS
jgi:hypothetical protein